MDINKISLKSILVVGDIMLDNYYRGNVSRISPEAPVPVFLKKKESSVLGGAANVAANLVAANQQVSLMSFIGNDENGNVLMSLLNNLGINTELVFRFERKTTVKTRFLAENNQQLLRMDSEDSTEISENEADRLVGALREVICRYDLIILSDYMKGLLTYRFCQGVIEAAKDNQIPVLIDVKDTKVEKYKGATLLKPNRNELKLLSGLSVNTDDEIITAAESLRNKCKCDYVLATLGSKGMTLVGDGKPYALQPEVREVYDVSGAGDTTIAYLATCLANKMSIRDAMKVATFAAGIQVGKVGTSSVSLDEVKEVMAEDGLPYNQKIITSTELSHFRERFATKKIVFTNGCFDILHVGHKRYLEQASALGDVFVIGVNSDASVNRLKGPGRPINSEQDRMEILSALGFVDYVVLFDEDTPYELIKKVQPDILVKGGDYTLDKVIGRDIVEARGGRVELIPFVYGKSTTNIINKISSNG